MIRIRARRKDGGAPRELCMVRPKMKQVQTLSQTDIARVESQAQPTKTSTPVCEISSEAAPVKASAVEIVMELPITNIEIEGLLLESESKPAPTPVQAQQPVKPDETKAVPAAPEKAPDLHHIGFDHFGRRIFIHKSDMRDSDRFNPHYHCHYPHLFMQREDLRWWQGAEFSQYGFPHRSPRQHTGRPFEQHP